MATLPPHPRQGRPTQAPGLLGRIDSLARAVFPGASIALLLVLAAAPVGCAPSVAAVALPCVFFWSVFRPAAMGPPVVAALGLMQDLLTFAPLGAGMITLLTVHGFAVRLRRFLARRGFFAVWLVFGGVALGAGLLGWILQAALTLRPPPLPPALHLSALAAGFYPPLAFVLARAHEAMRRAESAP